ncbi:MAG: polysaccharide deacetylase family protein [Cyclobacteriaceae bacterium]|nr:polysaccharide deacetylase family protein [Cyclobacteriaceae bacterium]
MIYQAPFFLPWLYPTLTWRIPTTEKQLYLTFDDGPVPGPTDFVLETLSKHSIKATFFCIGDNVRKHPEVFKNVVAQGHVIGNHTFNHVKGWKTPLNDYVENTTQCDSIVEALNSKPGTTNLFRPPYGRITRAQIKALSNYRIVMWDVLTHDYDQAKSPEACLKNSIRATRSGSIIVFHDSLKAERNMSYALPRYIDHFLGKGYNFNVLS